MYRNIEIVTYKKFYEDRDIIRPLLWTLACRPSYARYIKFIHIGVRKQRLEIQQYQCEHNANDFADEEEDSDDEVSIADPITEFGASVLDLLYQLKEKSLEGFQLVSFLRSSHPSNPYSWHLGSCTPASLLGDHAYLPLKQSRLKSLSITKNPSCWYSNRELLDLGRFRSLQTVSWRGIITASDVVEVGKMLQRNAKHLQDLELNIEGSQCQPLIQSVTTRQSSVHDMPVVFWSLKNLCLAGVGFGSISSDAIVLWNISRLVSLALNECPEVGDFLKTSIDIAQLTLKSFELVTLREPLGSPSTLNSFLWSFQSLERLHLSIDECSLDMGTIWKSIAHHKSTLRELVLNVNQFSFDVLFNGATLPDTDTLQLELDFLGLNCRLSDAKSRCHLIPGGQKLRMIHIRRGPYDGCLDLVNNKYDVAHDLDEFGNWVLGPKGLPNLEFIAYGDFTASYRCPQSRSVFRRAARSLDDHPGEPQVRYEKMPDEEIGFSPELSRFLASLEACPLTD